MLAKFFDSLKSKFDPLGPPLSAPRLPRGSNYQNKMLFAALAKTEEKVAELDTKV